MAPLALLILLAYLGKGSLASWDEAIYAVVSREVVRSNDWLRLTFGGSLWFDKPPLALWATAFFYKIIGISEFSSRLFSALCGFGTVLLTYFFGRSLFNRWIGLSAALVLLSSSHFIRVARFGVLDAPFLFFLTLSLYFFWLGRTKNKHLLFSGIAIGLAVMTKGFGGILIFPIIWIYAWWSDRLEILRRPSYWIGVFLAVLVALPWNLYEFFFHRQAFLQDVVFKHLIQRTTGAIEGHGGNTLFYLRVLVNKFHPWIVIGLVSAPLFLWKSWRDREDESIFVTVWMFFIFLFFTLVQTKLAWYIMPLYPALSLSIAYIFVKVFKERNSFYAKLIFLTVLFLHVAYSHILNADYSRPIKSLSGAVRGAVPEDAPVFLYRYHEQPAGIFYLERAVRYLETPAECESAAVEKGGFYCLVRSQDLAELTPILNRLGAVSLASFEGVTFWVISQK